MPARKRRPTYRGSSAACTVHWRVACSACWSAGSDIRSSRWAWASCRQADRAGRLSARPAGRRGRSSRIACPANPYWASLRDCCAWCRLSLRFRRREAPIETLYSIATSVLYVCVCVCVALLGVMSALHATFFYTALLGLDWNAFLTKCWWNYWTWWMVSVDTWVQHLSLITDLLWFYDL